MLATFCLRLALGLAASMLLLFGTRVTPGFFRVQFLVILGLLTAVLFFWWGSTPWIWVDLPLAMILAFAGSVVWMLEGAPGGKTLIALTVIAVGVITFRQYQGGVNWEGDSLPLVWEIWTSAALLGMATAAMLMGHSYLVEPGMSIAPLMRLLAGLFVGMVLRMAYSGVALVEWAPRLQWSELLWLMVLLRWGIGFAGPLLLGWMAWRCARIRSTQSATGILYVVVVLCFMGELSAQLLREMVREAISNPVQ